MADTFIWHVASGDWSVASNWVDVTSGDKRAPTAGDVVFIPAPAGLTGQGLADSLSTFVPPGSSGRVQFNHGSTIAANIAGLTQTALFDATLLVNDTVATSDVTMNGDSRINVTDIFNNTGELGLFGGVINVGGGLVAGGSASFDNEKAVFHNWGTLFQSPGTTTLLAPTIDVQSFTDISDNVVQSGTADLSGSVISLLGEISSDPSDATTSTVTAIVDTGGVWSTGQLDVAIQGNGLLQIQNGGSVFVQGGTVAPGSAFAAGIGTSGSGTVEVSGAGSFLQVTGDLVLGVHGKATMSVVSDGSVSVTGRLDLGFFGDGTGHLALTGSQTEVTVQQGIFVGGSDSGAGGQGVVEIDKGIGVTGKASATIYALGTVDLTGGRLFTDDAIDNEGRISGFGNVLAGVGRSTLTNNGTIVQTDGQLFIGADINGTGSMEVNGGNLDLGGSVDPGQAVSFAGGTLTLDSLPNDHVSIFDFAAGDVIFGDSFLADSGTFADNTLTLKLAGATEAALTVVGNFAADQFLVQNNGIDTTIELLCFLAGTLIRTARGDMPVETLRPGDSVTTLGGANRRIVWIGTGSAMVSRGRRNAATPVIVRRGALADNVPYRDLRLTKGHALFLDGVLIPVEELINHRSIAWDDHAQAVTVYHLELETHDVLLANGASAESYRDDGNRWLFQNWSGRNAGVPLEPCAPILTDGPIVDAIWRRLLHRSGKRPGVPLTEDPDLHLVVDGTRVDATGRDGAVLTFRLPASVGSAVVASRAAVPQELGTARDPRMLGVALRRIEIRRGVSSRAVGAADERLIAGFHQFEPDGGWRWTNGEAMLPASLFDGGASPVELKLQVGCAAMYPLFGIARKMEPQITQNTQMDAGEDRVTLLF